MGIKDKIAQRALGGVTGKAMKGLQPFMESIHARLELQNALLEDLVRIKLRSELKFNQEEVNEHIKKIKDKI